MDHKEKNKALGTEDVRWDLSEMYQSLDDPGIERDIAALEKMAAEFHAKHKGKLAEQLGRAIQDNIAISELSSRVFLYLSLTRTLEMGNEKVKTIMDDAQRRLSFAFGQYLEFLTHEVVALSDEQIEALAAADPVVDRHRPWLREVRKDKPHLLPEIVEVALAKRAPFGPSSWSRFFDEMESDLRFRFTRPGEKEESDLTLTEMLHIYAENPDAAVRAAALKTVNDGLGGWFHKLSTQTLNTVVLSKELSDRERNYPHPMASRNKSNMVSDAVVEGLHAAVGDLGGKLNRRFYRLKARLLGMDRLRWSDRNAPLPIQSEHEVPFPEALRMVIDGYNSFSPTLGQMVAEAATLKRLDVPCEPGRRGGAFNYTVILPGNRPISFVFQSYQGSPRDVMTLAHELGHYCHGLLAGEAQGALMHDAPMAYCETASVFGENVVFERLVKQAESAGDLNEQLVLLTDKANDILNTVVRQIGFSEFERRVHNEGRRLAPTEFDKIWLETAQALYGPDGDVFTYEDSERLWTYVSHFHRPFYVYSYAFGELLVHSLRAKADELGDRFEPLYLEMLRAGGTKEAVDLLAPFDLDPRDPDFWTNGLKISLQMVVEKAEAVAKQLDY